jgi:starch phosphorylase
MKRQLDDYYDRFYNKEAARFKVLAKDDNKLAKEIAAWKQCVAERWDNINVVASEGLENLNNIVSGQDFTIKHIVDEQGLDDAVGIELVVIENIEDRDVIQTTIPMQMVKREGNLHTFELTTSLDVAGSFKVGFRMYPKNANLPYRQDFSYVKWVG